MVEVKAIAEAYAVCKVANCGQGFPTTEEAWGHLKEHGLRAYYDVHLTLPLKKVEPSAVTPVKMKSSKQVIEEASAELAEEEEPEME